MQNIQFDYLFRDEDNYKEFGSVVFSNPQKLTIDFVETQIKKHLIEGAWFNPDQWHIPRFSFHQISLFGINELVWYEFDNISYTKTPPTHQSIDLFIDIIQKVVPKNF